jgi:predicted acetyltransferase
MQLVIPSLKYKDAYLDALKETANETQETQLSRPGNNQSFEAFIHEFIDHSKGINLPKGYVPATMFWLVYNGQVIGRVQIRHELNEFLLREGGHIGYYIRPSKRNKGYGKKILQMALVEAKRLGLHQVLVTCDEDNIGSKKIIETNGGVLEDSIAMGLYKPNKLRYWIPLS